METPDRPSVSPSEPEAERRIVEKAMEDIKEGAFDRIQVYLPYAKEFLKERGLDVDDDGFIVTEKSREYAVPWTFVEDLVKERVKSEDESVFEAFFRPVTHERVYGWDNERLHLSDLHSIIKVDGAWHPVRYDTFTLAEMHARLETGFRGVMGWSDLLKEENADEQGRWLGLAKGLDGSDNRESLSLNCLSADCGYTGPLSSWDGAENTDPECPECGGKWDNDGISVCTICHRWHWGTYFAGESMYAEPACPNCNADMEYLERVHRYDDIESFEALVEDTRPEYTVVGLDGNGSVVYTFDHVATWDDAVEEKNFAEGLSAGTFDEVERVAIRERDEVSEVTRFVREDDQPT